MRPCLTLLALKRIKFVNLAQTYNWHWIWIELKVLPENISICFQLFFKLFPIVEGILK